MTRKGVVLGWAVALVGAGWLLMTIGHGPLAPPPGAEGSAGLRQWASVRDAPTMTMSGLRLLAVVLDGYLLATVVLGTAARLTRSARAIRVVDVITPRSVRRLLGTAVGGLVLSTPIVGPVAIAARTPVAPPPLVRMAGNSPVPARTGSPPLVRAAGQPPLLRRVGVPGITTTPAGVPDVVTTTPADVPHRATTPATAPPPMPEPQPAPPLRPHPPRPPEPPPPGVTLWTVRPGDSFWRIARLQIQATRPDPTAAEIVPYVRVLIDANRDRLRTGDPHWIYPMQVLVIPAP